ncbi:HTH-type transcriptional repressor PurR [Ralstonia syzygii subsp. syzygii]|nr:HTH-type transcriptional repressor PurR [Ralstonia syzygii subsp. syzygii]
MASSIKDVATHAGISIATVSRAINAPERVSPETLARVQAAMDALQYRPNALVPLHRGYDGLSEVVTG